MARAKDAHYEQQIIDVDNTIISHVSWAALAVPPSIKNSEYLIGANLPVAIEIARAWLL